MAMSWLIQYILCPLPSYCPSPRVVLSERIVHALLNKSHLPRIQMPSPQNYSRSEIKIKIYFVFRSLIRNIELRSKVLAFGKIKFLLLFRSLIRTFAHDFNKHVDRFGLLATTEKNAKRKDLLGTGTTGL